MSTVAIIALVSATLDIAIRLLHEYQAAKGTPEEQLAKLEQLKRDLVATAASVAAYKPLPLEEQGP